jgi:adenylate kinase family enzyme
MYKEAEQQVLVHYREKGVLTDINANQPIETVQQEILSKLQ